MKKASHYFWNFVSVTVLGLVLLTVDKTLKSDEFVYDYFSAAFRLKADSEPASDVIIVKLTDESLAAYPPIAGNFNYPRQALADLVRAINLTKPGLLVIDVFLDEAGDPTADDALVSALAQSNTRVLLAQDIFWDKRGLLGKQPVLEKFLIKAEARPSYFEVGDKGVVRRMNLAADGVETLPMRAASLLGKNELSGRSGSVPITYDWRGSKAFTQIAAEGILELHRADPNRAFPPLAKSVTQNTVVLIAPFYRASRDYFSVPNFVDAENGELRGSEVLGFAIRTAMQGAVREWIVSAKFWKQFLLVIFPSAGLGYWLAIYRAKLLKRFKEASTVSSDCSKICKRLKCLILNRTDLLGWLKVNRPILLRLLIVCRPVFELTLTFGGAFLGMLLFGVFDIHAPILTILVSFLFGYKGDAQLAKVEPQEKK